MKLGMTGSPKKEFISRLFSELERKRVDYFVMGEYESLPTDTGGSDIDIVLTEVTPQQLKECLRYAMADGDVNLASYYTNPGAELYRFIAKDWGVQIDFLLNGLHYRGVRYYPTSKLESHTIYHNGIRVLEQQYGFYVDFFKEIIHNGCAKAKYCEALLQRIKDNENEVREDVTACYSEETWTIIGQNLSVEKLNAAGAEIRNAILGSFDSKAFLLHKIKYSALRMGRLLQLRPGYVIVVEGTDGSGKSAIINAITPWLNECFHNGVVYNHLRPKLLPDIAILLGKRSAKEKGEVVDNPHSGKPSGLLGSLVRWNYYMLDYTVGYVIKVWTRIKTRSYVYLFDRYYYDYYIDPIRSRTNLPHWILRIGELFVPKPNIVLCLGGEPEKIYARKPETSLAEVTRQTDELRRFAAKRKNAVWIDTTKPIEDSMADAKSAILLMMSTRFKDVL